MFPPDDPGLVELLLGAASSPLVFHHLGTCMVAAHAPQQADCKAFWGGQTCYLIAIYIVPRPSIF